MAVVVPAAAGREAAEREGVTQVVEEVAARVDVAAMMVAGAEAAPGGRLPPRAPQRTHQRKHHWLPLSLMARLRVRFANQLVRELQPQPLHLRQW